MFKILNQQLTIPPGSMTPVIMPGQGYKVLVAISHDHPVKEGLNIQTDRLKEFNLDPNKWRGVCEMSLSDLILESQ